MVVKKDRIEALIAEAESEKETELKIISLAQRKIDRCNAQIEAYFLVLGKPAPGDEQAEKAPKQRRKRKPSGTWTKVLQEVAVRGPMTLDDVEAFMESIGSPTVRKNIRSQMSNYRKKGIVADEGVAGVFSLTESARAEYLPAAETTQEVSTPANDVFGLGPLPDKNEEGATMAH